MYEPQQTPAERGEVYYTAFGGYDRNPVIPETSFYDETNLSADGFPLLQPRPKRAFFSVAGDDLHGLVSKKKLCYVLNGRLFYGGVEVAGVNLPPVSRPRRFVSMGAKLVIFPDKVYVNTADLSDFGPLEAAVTTASGSTVTLTPCTVDGEPLQNCATAAAEPADPADGALWIDTSRSPAVLRCYSSALSIWEELVETYVRLSCPGVGVPFREGDGVTLAGVTADPDLNGAHVLVARGDDYLVVAGLTPGTVSQTGAVTVSRTVPELDFVCESGNRLWGCCSARNEIYASKLGDPTNWNCFAGLSTDSYAVTVGTDGDFTGAVPFRGYILFFKENCVHKVYGANPPYTVLTSYLRGVQKGSERSLVVLNELLFYKSPTGVCCYEGGVPTDVSAALGRLRYTDAVAGTLGDKLYLCVSDAAGVRTLFTYDTVRGVWHREDQVDVREFCTHNGNLFFIAADGDTLRLGTVDSEHMVGSFTAALAGWTTEEEVPWSAETGMWGLDLPQQKYYSQISLRLIGERGARVSVACEYDSSGVWRTVKTWRAETTGTVTLPFACPRCDHLRLRLSGMGRVRLLGVAATVEKGSRTCMT